MLIVLLLLCQLSVQATKVKVGPYPDWAEPVMVDTKTMVQESEVSHDYGMIQKYQQYNLEKQMATIGIVRKIFSESGGQYATIWLTYLRRSRRAQTTFVERYQVRKEGKVEV